MQAFFPVGAAGHPIAKRTARTGDANTLQSRVQANTYDEWADYFFSLRICFRSC